MFRKSLPIRNQLAVRTPRQRSVIHAGKCRQLARRGCGLRIHDENIVVLHAIRIGLRLVAHKSDHRPVGRPLCVLLVVLAGIGGQLRQLLCGDVEQVQLRVLVRQIAVDVLLEVIAIDHDRLRRLRLCVLVVALWLVFLTQRQQQLLRIRRPSIVAQILLHIRHLARLAAAPVHHPYLRTLCLPRPRRSECQIASVRTPLRRTRRFRAVGQLKIVRAIPIHHPQLGDVLIVLRIDA